MRVIAGTYRARQIAAVPGQLTRPTTDRVREAWASTLTSIRPDGFQSARVLDAFAGSGALGIEALSRGAEAVLFIDKQTAALKTIRANLHALDPLLPDNQRVLVANLNILKQSEQPLLERLAPYDLVFLDPPYDYARLQIAELMQTLIERNLLAKHCLVSYEQSAKKRAATKPDPTKSAPVLANLRQRGEEQQPADPWSSSEAQYITDPWPPSLEVVSCKTYGDTLIEYSCFQLGE